MRQNNSLKTLINLGDIPETIKLSKKVPIESYQEISVSDFAINNGFQWSEAIQTGQSDNSNITDEVEKISTLLSSSSLFKSKNKIITRQGVATLVQNLEAIRKRLIIAEMGSFGKGLFLDPKSNPIPKDTIVLAYTGLLAPQTQFTAADCVYTIATSYKQETYSICSHRYGNLSRFVQHANPLMLVKDYYQEIPKIILDKMACANLEMKEYLIDGVLINLLIATEELKPGEQLLFDYGNDYWLAKQIMPKAFSKQGIEFHDNGDFHERYVTYMIFYFFNKKNDPNADPIGFFESTFHEIKLAWENSGESYEQAANDFYKILREKIQSNTFLKLKFEIKKHLRDRSLQYYSEKQNESELSKENQLLKVFQ